MSKVGYKSYKSYLTANKFIPLSHKKLVNLKFLSVSLNQLGTIPPGLFSALTELHILSMDSTGLSILPPVAHMKGLVRLSLRLNNLSTLPPLPASLTHLDISGNPFVSIPLPVLQLPNLRILDLSITRITEFPTELITISSLHNLNVSCTLISSLPSNFAASFPGLERLDISFCRFEEFPGELLASNQGIELKAKSPGALRKGRPAPSSGDSTPPSSTKPGTETGIGSTTAATTKTETEKGEIPTIPNDSPPSSASSTIEPIADSWANLIVPNVYLGSLECAKNWHWLKNNGITHILTLFKYLVIEVDDTEETLLSAHLDNCIDFIDSAVNNKTSILIHCHAGISRSASVTIAYVAKKMNMSVKDAHTFVHEKRSRILPKTCFLNQIKTWLGESST
ncbi:dual specificity protein phosphatase 1 [Pelomyxa schiedti]|nr:dual specificity protein phosphatase 1 [Pelomyxa schiedti]